MASDEQTLDGRLLLWAADWLTVLLLSVGLVFPCLAACGISGQHGFDSGAVLAFCVFASLAAAALFTWRRWLWAALALLAAGGVVLWRLWEHTTEDWLLGRPPGLTDLTGQYPGALYLLYALAVLALAWTVVRVRRWWLAAALVVIPVLPAIQAGVLPAWGAMLMGFAGWGSMLLTGLFGREDPRSLARARFLSLGGMAALLTLLVMCLPSEGYLRPQWATDARAGLIRGVSRRLVRFFSPEALENNLLTQLGLDLSVPGEGPGTVIRPGEGPNAIESIAGGSGQRENLLNAGPRSYTGRQLMTVRTSQPGAAGRIYLRGMSFDNYTGTSWENSFRSDAQPGLYPALTAPDAAEYTMTIRNTDFRGIWYYPYRFTGGGPMTESGQMTGLDGGREGEPDQIPLEEMVNTGMEGYRITYRPGGPADGFSPLEDAWQRDEETYLRGGPYSFEGSYLALSVPYGTAGSLAFMEGDIRQVEVETDPRLPEQFREPVAAAARTANLLARDFRYDTDVPAMDPDGDFLDHFLEEGRGYCVHFATLGVMLLRLQGVPARYVSGYVVNLDAHGRGVVRDSDAHAWVEIYLEGYGWYPVEMTPGYSGGGISGVELKGAAGVPDPAEPEPDVPEEEPPEEEPPGGEETPGDEGETPGEEPPEGETPSEEEPPEERRIAIPWKVLFGAALFWAALCAAYLLALLERRRARADADTNRSVLNAYGRYKRLRRWGCGEDEELARLAKKARFSQHTLTAEERASAWKCLDEDVKQSRVGQPVRRRWLLALLCPIF